MDTYPLSNLIRSRCVERTKPGRGKPVLILHIDFHRKNAIAYTVPYFPVLVIYRKIGIRVVGVWWPNRVIHCHRTSTSIGLPLSRPLTCCHAHAQTRLHALAFSSSLSLCMPAPMASRFSSSASGAEGSDTRRTTRSEGL